MRFLEEVGGHLVGEKSAAAAILPHVDDETTDCVSFQRAIMRSHSWIVNTLLSEKLSIFT